MQYVEGKVYNEFEDKRFLKEDKHENKKEERG